jgi:hypothetical protein
MIHSDGACATSSRSKRPRCSARKAVDVAAAGGWGDTEASTRICQQADAGGVAAAVIG